MKYTNKVFTELNNHIKAGYIKVTESDLVWGPAEVETGCGYCIKRKVRKFLGGGVSDNLFTIMHGDSVLGYSDNRGVAFAWLHYLINTKES